MYRNIYQTFSYKEKKLYRGYIKEYRKITEWEWYKDINTCHLFRHCLYKANIEDKKWRGQEVKRGSFITSYEHLAFETGLSVQQVRTALNKLKLTNELTHKTTSQYSIITINNYELYQDNNKQDNKQITNEQQTNNKPITTTKEYKNDNNDNNKRERDRKILEKYLLSRKRTKPIDNIDAYIDNIKPNSLDRLIEKAYKWYEKQNQNNNNIVPITKNEQIEISEEEELKIKEIQEKIKRAKK